MSEPAIKRQKTGPSPASDMSSLRRNEASSERSFLESFDLPSSGSANTVSSRLPAMPRSQETPQFPLSEISQFSPPSAASTVLPPSLSTQPDSRLPSPASLLPPSLSTQPDSRLPSPAKQDLPCNSSLTPTQKESLIKKTNPYFTSYSVSHERIVRLNDEEYAVFGNFTFTDKEDNLPFSNVNDGYQLISLSTSFSTFNDLWEKSFDIVIPRVCHVFSMSDKNPKFYVTDNGDVTEGAGNTSIFFSSSKTSFQLPVTLDTDDVVTDFKLLKTGSETNYIVYCAAKVNDNWLAVDVSQMWINASAKKLLFDYLRPKEKAGMATMANYMYSRNLRSLDNYPAWQQKMYEKNSTVKKDEKFYTAVQNTDKQPPDETWNEMFPDVYAEFAFHLPVSVEKLKFPDWIQKAYVKGDTVSQDGTLYHAIDATASQPPSVHWKRIDPSKGQCTGKASLMSYAIIRANTQKFMGGAHVERPWKLALGKATWFDQRPGKFVAVSSLATEPHWMFV